MEKSSWLKKKSSGQMKDRIVQPRKSLPETKGKPLAEINVLLYIFWSRIQICFSFMAFCACLWYCTLTEIAASLCSAGRCSNCRQSVWICSCSSKADLATSSSHKPQGTWFFKSFVLTFMESVYAGSGTPPSTSLVLVQGFTLRLSVLCSLNIKAMFTAAEYG